MSFPIIFDVVIRLDSLVFFILRKYTFFGLKYNKKIKNLPLIYVKNYPSSSRSLFGKEQISLETLFHHHFVSNLQYCVSDDY